MNAEMFLYKKAEEEQNNDTNIIPWAAATATGLGVGGWNTYRYGKTIGNYNKRKGLLDEHKKFEENGEMSEKLKKFKQENKLSDNGLKKGIKNIDTGFNRGNKWLAIGGLGTALYTGVKTMDAISNTAQSNVEYVK